MPYLIENGFIYKQYIKIQAAKMIIFNFTPFLGDGSKIKDLLKQIAAIIQKPNVYNDVNTMLKLLSIIKIKYKELQLV